MIQTAAHVVIECGVAVAEAAAAGRAREGGLGVDSAGGSATEMPTASSEVRCTAVDAGEMPATTTEAANSGAAKMPAASSEMPAATMEAAEAGAATAEVGTATPEVRATTTTEMSTAATTVETTAATMETTSAAVAAATATPSRGSIDDG